ncbi:MAG: glutamate racemase [Verrucomicrobiae bacterium]|nr:glutamate racemase [Verrucomicrobiae bacterium]
MNPLVGIFDSGVGGLSVLKAIRLRLPQTPLVYVADQAHVPYGPRPVEDVRALACGIVRFLKRQGAGIIVVACNTASAAALHELRRLYPRLVFVGMEPAVKPAAIHTRSGVVGVLATQGTLRGKLYASVVERFAHGRRVMEDPCAGLVAEIEKGHLNGDRTRDILQRALAPMLASGADTIVLGCTHYPFVLPLIREIAGEGVQVIDPAPAIARRVAHLLAHHQAVKSAGVGALTLLTTGKPGLFQRMAGRFLESEVSCGTLAWRDMDLEFE